MLQLHSIRSLVVALRELPVARGTTGIAELRRWGVNRALRATLGPSKGSPGSN